MEEAEQRKQEQGEGTEKHKLRKLEKAYAQTNLHTLAGTNQKGAIARRQTTIIENNLFDI